MDGEKVRLEFGPEGVKGFCMSDVCRERVPLFMKYDGIFQTVVGPKWVMQM